MKNLNNNEIILINGGTDCDDVCTSQVPTPADSEDQLAQTLGEEIGEALGNTIRQVGQIADALWPF